MYVCNDVYIYIDLAVDDLLAGSPLVHLMRQIKMQCMVDVKSPEEARARRGASALMCAISAHPRAAALVLGEVSICTFVLVKQVN